MFEDEAEEARTPWHLTLGRRLVSEVPIAATSDVDRSRQSLIARYRYVHTIIEHYWKRFSREYLLGPHQHHLNVHKGSYNELCKLLLEDVVLIKPPSNTILSNEKKDQFHQLIGGEGEDGQVRGAVLKVNTSGLASYIRRPVQKLIPLEVQKEQFESTSTADAQEIPSVANTSSHQYVNTTTL